MLWLVKIWQVSSCRKFIQHLETCLLSQLKLTKFFVNLWCFILSFSTGYIKWNTAAINSLLLFTAGLFIEFFVEKCTACQSWKSDFGWYCFRFWPCWMRVEKTLKRFWPYLIAFMSYISNGKPEQLLCTVYVFFFSFICLISWSRVQFMRLVYTCLYLRSETVIWSSMRFDISLQGFKKPLADIFSPQIERKNVPKSI